MQRIWVLGLMQLMALFLTVMQAGASNLVPMESLSSAAAERRSSNSPGIYLYAGESIIQSAHGLQRVAVGDQEVADVKIFEEDAFLINGVGPGHTTLMIWDADGLETVNLVVTARPPLDLEYVAKLVEAWGVRPSWWQEYLVLRGTVSSEVEKSTVENIVQSVWDPVISLVIVEDDAEQFIEVTDEPIEYFSAQELQAALGMPEIQVQVVKNLAILEGEVADPGQRLRAGEIARQFVPEVLNLVRISQLPVTTDAAIDASDVGLDAIDDTENAEGSVEVLEDIRALCATWGYTLNPIGEILMLEGEAYDTTQKAAVIELLAAHDFAYIDNTTVRAPQPSTADLPHLQAMLQELPGLKDVTLVQKGSRLIIEGHGRDRSTIELAQELVEDYGTPLGLKVSNLLCIPEVEVTKPPASLIQAEIGIPGLVVRWVGDQLVLAGSLSQEAHTAAVALATQYSSQVIDLISGKSLSALTLAEIEALLASDTVAVTAIGDTVVLRGEVASVEQREAMLAAASVFGYPVIDGMMVVHEHEEMPVFTAADVEEAIGLELVKVRIVNGTILLEGEVENPDSKVRAEIIAGAFGEKVIDLIQVTVTPEPVDGNWESLAQEASAQGARLYKVGSIPVLEGVVTSRNGDYLESLLDSEFSFWINNLSLIPPPPAPPPPISLVKSALANPDIQCHYLEDTLVLQGSVTSIGEQQRIETLAEVFGIPVQSFLTVTDEVRQVWVDVCMLELSQSRGREIGIEWEVGLGADERQSGESVELPSRLSENAVTLDARSASSLIVGPLWAEAHLRSLLHTGEARILASPSLLTENGKQAEFLAGGEIPVPAESQGIEWKSYGVGLTVTPTILGNGSIHLQVEPEVSSLDWENAVQLEDSYVPGVRTRRWRTQAAVEPGKALVIGGLLSEKENTVQRQVPVLGELPILGALFRSEAKTNQKTDLIVLVSPRLVQVSDCLWSDVSVEP